MDPLAGALEEHLRDLMAQAGGEEGGRLLIALSGGPDSLCLAHLLGGLRETLGLELIAAHLDHGIRAGSAGEAEQVATICHAWGIECVVAREDVPTLARRWHLSLEEAARRARYTFLARVAR